MSVNPERLDLIKYLHERRRRKSSLKPLEGPYYWLPLPGGGYQIYSYPTETYGDDITHTEIWRKGTAETLGLLWDLPEAAIEKIRRHPYGIPRGRVSKGVGRIYINHGMDSPESDEGVLRQVGREFNLMSLIAQGKVKLAFDNHEVMQYRDQVVVDLVLGMSRVFARRGL